MTDIEKIQRFVDKHAQPFYEKGPLGETHTIKFEEFCWDLKIFIDEDRKRVVKPLINLKLCNGGSSYEYLCQGIEKTLNNAGYLEGEDAKT